MIRLSNRINNLAESETIKMSRISRELQAQGNDIINLSLGEPDFDTPTHIREAAKKAIDDGYSHYPPISGYLDVRQAISDKFKRENNLDYSIQQIVVSTGAKQAIANVVLSLLNPGDEVILPVPYWVSYVEIAKLAEAKPVYIPTDIKHDFKITPEQLKAAITPKTKLLIYSSPCNPSGSVYSKEELKGIAEVIASYPDIYIISDEIYEHINFIGKHESIAQFDFIKDRVVTVNGVSKAFAMTGWRIGYIGAPEWIAKACDKMQGQFTSAACSISEMAAKAALNSDITPTKKMCEEFLKRRNLILNLMKDIPGIKLNEPKGAFYVFPDVSYYFNKSDGNETIHDANELSMYLLNKAHVSIVSGEAFGDCNCIRISYAASEDKLKEAIKRIKAALEKLN